MGNFLTNLAMRAHQTGAQVHPRLPALFEPARPGGEVLRGIAAAELSDAPVSTESSAGPPDVRQPVVQQSRRRVKTRHAGTEAEPRGPTLTTAHPSRVPPSVPPPDRTLNANDTVSRHRTDLPIAKVIDAGDAPAAQPQQQLSRGVDEAPVRTAAPEHATPEVNRPAALHATPQVQSMADTAIAQRPTAPPLETQQRVSVRLTPPIAVTGGRKSPEPETVVNISIGRVEVRAAPEDSSPPRQRNTAPLVMTLDEYLRAQRLRRSQ